MAEKTTTFTCGGCGMGYPSRNSLFKHLRDTAGACLKGEEYQDFLRCLRSTDRGVKVVLLFGYLPVEGKIRNGDDAAEILLQAIQAWQSEVDGFEQQQQNKYSRSYGCSQRGVSVVAQDEGAGAITEVLTTYLQPLPKNISVDDWLDQVQFVLNAIDESCSIRLLGRQDIAAKTFNAEMDVSHRRIEYLLPVDFLNACLEEHNLVQLPTFSENHKHNLSHKHNTGASRVDEPTRLYLFRLKKLMKSMTTPVIELDKTDKAAVMEKSFSLQKRKGNARRSKKRRQTPKEETQNSKNDNNGDDNTPDSKEQGKPNAAGPQENVLRRKRFHNFTPNLMAHEYLAFRRLDRIYHRATLSFPHLGKNTSTQGSTTRNRRFILLSFSGDVFLTGQICRLVGVFLAMANGYIDPEILDCLFDENYPHLIPTPPAPIIGMVAGEANYMSWEGKLKSILAARSTDRYPAGWNQVSTLERVERWRDCVHENIASRWLSQGCDKSGRLVAEREWSTEVLEPWAKKAKQHLDDYRKWKTLHSTETVSELSTLPQVVDCEVDTAVPEEYLQVLQLLREVDQSGRWPSTTPKRQLVMISTPESGDGEEKESTSLTMARVKARDNTATRSSAYAFTQGQGGASGSFSVGFMPGGGNRQPKSNELFPELVQAAFKLERTLCPDREPSSTIAINRNAQFRPHTDSGAGAGQSSSLIVGLGAYAGGELMVEGVKQDIRYNAIEFNGWKQRHWTLPFVGERYSLVWFTPKGCEGQRGIDLTFEQEVN
eukprot:Nitzschia sp. Nitz4//scaffold251_size28233//9144//11447//NITZ4_008133-RA/size28233-processed-gene-0.11-mRNA-1//-1//CDS//3329544241//5387//frame0